MSLSQFESLSFRQTHDIWLSQFLPYKIKITTNYEISYFDFNIDRKSTLNLYLFDQPFLKILQLETSIISKSLFKNLLYNSFIYSFQDMDMLQDQFSHNSRLGQNCLRYHQVTLCMLNQNDGQSKYQFINYLALLCTNIARIFMYCILVIQI